MSVSPSRHLEEVSTHHVGLPGSDWSLWRWVELRGAGFPIGHALELAAEAAFTAAKRAVAAKEAVEVARQAVLAKTKRFPEGADKEERKELRKLRKRVWQDKPPGPPVALEPPEAESLRAAWEELERAQGAYGAAFESAQGEESERLRWRVGDRLFQEAILWQNPRLLGEVRERLLKSGAPRMKPSQRHALEATLLRYVHRYATKNDSIGFFGPAGWGRWDELEESLALEPGKGLIEHRQVYFEAWCIDTLGASLLEDLPLRPWLRPRRAPVVGLADGVLHPPMAEPRVLDGATADLLELCTGELTAGEIARRLSGRSGNPGTEEEARVLAALERLEAQKVIYWNLEGPLETYPERTLRRALLAVGDAGLRRLSLARLDSLEAARGAVADAAGDPESLAPALEGLNETFERATGSPSYRNPGQIYAARTLVYEDCRREVEVRFGRSLLEAAGPPLSLLLTAARWLTERSAQTHREHYLKIYRQLAAEKGQEEVHAVDFWSRALAQGQDPEKMPQARAVRDLQSRWARALELGEHEGRRVQRSVAELAPAVAEHFPSARPGWPNAYQHSPDMMIAADGAEAVERGDFLLVLGELHAAVNTLGVSSSMELHPKPGEITSAYAEERPQPFVTVAFDKKWPWNTARSAPTLRAPGDLVLEYGDEPSGAAGEDLLLIGDLAVREAEGELVFRHRRRDLSLSMTQACGGLLSTKTASTFQLMPGGAYSPRITIGRLVVSRETWRFEVGELPWLGLKHQEDRYLQLCSWALERGIPRFAFFKLPIEPKPCFLDLGSPMAVDIFIRRLRRTQTDKGDGAKVMISEMLPRPDQLWLEDAQGGRYTSELRLVAVDPSKILLERKPIFNGHRINKSEY